MTRFLQCILGALLVAAPAYAQHHQNAMPLHIVIEAIDGSKQRYPTAGDWQIKPDGLHITVSRMSERRYEFLTAMHEAVEAFLCQQAGVSQATVDKFDKAYEAKRRPGDNSEPGDDPKAPYHREHVFASKVERILADEFGVDWSAYDREVSSK